MVRAYRCGTKRRAAAVKGSAELNGIDYLVVGPGEITLDVHFLNGLPGSSSPVPPPPAPQLTAGNIAIDGGVRFGGIVADGDPAVSGNVLTVTLDRPGFQPGGPMGDYSIYTFRLRKSELDDNPPDGFDLQLSQVDFSFKAGCESDFDCAAGEPCPPRAAPAPDIDYLAKDYVSFRQLMLDRMAVTMPAWREQNAADVEIALVELLAYVGDRLSYFQDAVATEAYLGTALRRRSIRRHARLLDYPMHEGCNARAWVCLEVNRGGGAEGLVLPTGAMVITAAAAGEPVVVDPARFAQLAQPPDQVVFETMTPVTLRSAHNLIRFHTWDEEGCALPAGATSATLVAADGVTLQAGDVLVFEEVLGPVSGAAADADPAHRWTVRLTGVAAGQDKVTGTPVLDVSWAPEDALPFCLCISSRSGDGLTLYEDVSVTRGNVVLADHGRTIVTDPTKPPTDPVPAVVPGTGSYEPVLSQGTLTFAAPSWPLDKPATSARGPKQQPAAAATAMDPVRALPAVTSLNGGGLSWHPQLDLLGSDRFAADFVVEMDADGTAHLRFGDGEHGRKPVSDSVFRATYRVGNGTQGNVGAGALARLVPNENLYPSLAGGVTRVWNPMPATSGVDPEPIERVKLLAPQAFRRQERAVTEPDYAVITERMPGVHRAATTLRWTGSWYTAFVAVDRAVPPATAAGEASFEAAARAWLDLYRMAGTDVEVDRPVMAPLDIALGICVAPGYFTADIERAILGALGARILPDGTTGFFYPGNFTFGQPVYLSQVYAAALAVAGVRSVQAIRFQRWGRESNHELENGVLTVGRLEIVRLDNDPSFPENGRLELKMSGGR